MKRKINKSNRNPYDIEGIQINKKLLKKYLHKEVVKRLIKINDLSQISIKTETEILKVLEQMIKSKNYFKYCSSLLININPGPNNIYDYLNLKKWDSSQKNSNLEDKNPHLYTFMQYVYETMVTENKDQVVNFLGPIGSGKTFNLIHTMEFFTSMYGPKNYKNELFELIHNSIQLIHIFGSIYRENNIESTSCGIVLKLGFNQNNIISNFDIEAQILDLSLPFTETGRTFSIFHAFIKGANDELKKKVKIPEDDKYLSFFNNYLSNFSEKVREKLAFNDLETWNKFYSLSKYFKFSSDEILDILKCLAIILNLNELTISKVQITKEVENENVEEQEEEKEEQKEVIEYFEIQKGKILKKICKNLGIKTKEFLNLIGKFKSLNEAKHFLITFMKQTYYIIFEFILNKMRDYINLYFNQLNEKIGTNNFKRNKIIYFIDFPGEVEHKNLGGFTTNISNECLNMYAATGFYEIAEKLIKENIYLNKFFPIQSYFAVSTCMEKEGVLEHLSKPLSKQNFNSLMNNSLSKINFNNCIKFQKTKLFEENNYNFTYTFSYKKVEYNLENLISEAKSTLRNELIIKIFSASQNYVINSTYKNIIINNSKDFYSFFTSILRKIFEPIKDIKPFNIFYLHSYNSYKIFFKDKVKENEENQNNEGINKSSIETNRSNKKNKKNVNSSYEEENIPKEPTLNLIKNSFIMPILFWNWQGFKEWIHIDEFIKEYSYDFEKIKDRIIQINNSDPDKKKFDSKIIIKFEDLPKEEIAKCTLGILAKEGDYLIGKEYILMKTGTLKRMRLYLNSMIDTAEKMNYDLKEKIKKANEEKQLYSRRKSSDFNEINLSKIEEINDNRKRTSSLVKKFDDIRFKYEQNPIPIKKQFKKLEENNSRRYLLKEQCIVNIFFDEKIISDDEKRKILKGKYFNLYYLITNRNTTGKEDEKRDKIYLEELQINKKENDSINGISDRKSLKEKDSINQNKLLKLNRNEKYLENIIKIQSHIRKIISKNKYTILKYIYSEILLIQKSVRGFLTRIKFKKFLGCLAKIKKIQRIYHRRHIIRVRSITKIQEFYIRKLTQKKLREKIIAKKKAEAKGEYFNIDIEPYVEFTHNNYNLENALKIIRVKNNKEKLTNQLINEKDPKRILDILLYGTTGRKNLTRAQKLGIEMKIEDKLINQGEIMKRRKQSLAKKYENKLKEDYQFKPTINKGTVNYGQVKKTEFIKLFKDNNTRKPKKEDFKNSEFEKIYNERNYDLYMKNIFDRLYNEKLKIEQRIKMREKYLEKNPELKENKKIIKKEKDKLSLKELLLSDELKELYKNNSPEIINKNEIWPKKLKNSYLDKFMDEKLESSLSPIKNSGFDIIEEKSNELFE